MSKEVLERDKEDGDEWLNKKAKKLYEVNISENSSLTKEERDWAKEVNMKIKKIILPNSLEMKSQKKLREKKIIDGIEIEYFEASMDAFVKEQTERFGVNLSVILHQINEYVSQRSEEEK